jgi:O-antigen biosynthesis protein
MRPRKKVVAVAALPLPPAPEARSQPALPIGCVDVLTNDEISGWVWDPAHPDDAIAVEILDGDNVALKIVADMHREDLAGAGVGNGRHGFQILSPGSIFTQSRHRIRIRRASDGADLLQNVGWIVRERTGFDSAAADYLEHELLFTVEQARTPDDLDQPLAVLLGALNSLVNARMTLDADKRDGARHVLQDLPYQADIGGGMRDLVIRLQQEYAPLHFEPTDTPLVSIVIPVYNQFRTTYNCLRSIHEHPPKASFEIIIVDDCSSDETILASLVLSGAVRILRNPRNLGFVLGCNAGAAVARGTYLFFLNNDTLVRDGWLDELIATFENVPNIGIAGSKLLFEDGKLQEAGGIIWRLGDGWNWGRGRDPNEPAFCYLRDSDWVSGAALMIRADLFGSLSGFDQLYVPAYYEDTDIAFRVRAAGKRVVMQPASEIVHLEGVSAGTDVRGTGMKRYQAVNHRKFRERWSDTLARHRFNGQQPELEAERFVKRRAFFIDDTVPTPDKDAGSNAALEHMVALMALGYKVTFLPADNMAQINPYTANLQKLGIECLYAPFYWSVEEVFRKTQIKPDLVYLHRYVNAAKYATMTRRYFPDCRIVYNVADLHFLRMEREAELRADARLEAQARDQRRAEIAVMRDVDGVIVHSSFEAELLREAEPSLAVTVVPWTVSPRPTPLSFADRAGFAFVGGYGHPPNVDAALYLAQEIMPLVRQQLDGVTAYLVGSHVPPAVTALQAPDIDVVGFVPALADALHRLRCTVVPLRFGAGLKGKVLESFAHGLPCVMSEVAAEGMDLPEPLDWLIARSPDEFAEKLAKVHEDKALNARLAKAGLAFIESRFSSQFVGNALNTAITGKEQSDRIFQ